MIVKNGHPKAENFIEKSIGENKILFYNSIFLV